MNTQLQSSSKYNSARNSKFMVPASKLSHTIKHYESEETFDILVKIGDANAMLKELSDPSKFQVSSLESNKFKIIYTQVQNQQELSQLDFQRVFKQIERRLNQHKNKNFWNVDLRKEKEKISNFKGTMMLVLQEKDEVTKEKINARIKQRDQELKSVLLETAHLKMLLQEQYQILERKGINK